jgi:hypothetical protein
MTYFICVIVLQLKPFPMSNSIRFLSLPTAMMTRQLDLALEGKLKADVVLWTTWLKPKTVVSMYQATVHPQTREARIQNTVLTNYLYEMTM